MTTDVAQHEQSMEIETVKQSVLDLCTNQYMLVNFYTLYNPHCIAMICLQICWHLKQNMRTVGPKYADWPQFSKTHSVNYSPPWLT